MANEKVDAPRENVGLGENVGYIKKIHEDRDVNRAMCKGITSLIAALSFFIGLYIGLRFDIL